MKELVRKATEYTELLLADPYRPRYHFAIPGDNGMPGDSNGAFFADGVYHLMYLYESSVTGGFHWGHMTSRNLLHWRRHKDALTVSEGDRGCFSGGAFLDEDGTAYLTFWKFAAVDPEKDRSGIAMAYARPPYEDWTRMEPIAVNATEWGILDLVVDGETKHLACADPSNIWKNGEYYYMQLGNLCVLDKYGRKEDSPEEYQGGWTELFRSKDLHTWEYVHRFYANTHTGENDWPDRTEDDMCPSFLPLYDAPEGGKPTGKWLQVFIAHNRGCQYFVGSLKDETFYPEIHGRMSWKDITYFAPEALIDGRGRQILWTWLRDNRDGEFEKYGWSGVYGFPRVLWWEDDELHMAPAEELDRLRYGWLRSTPKENGPIPVADGTSFRLKAEWDEKITEPTGFRVRENSAGTEYAEILYDPQKNVLVLDNTRNGAEGWALREEAPFTLKAGEKLRLDIFVDQSVVEVYANDRQAICRRIYPADPQDSAGIRAVGTTAAKVDTWGMDSANEY